MEEDSLYRTPQAATALSTSTTEDHRSAMSERSSSTDRGLGDEDNYTQEMMQNSNVLNVSMEGFGYLDEGTKEFDRDPLRDASDSEVERIALEFLGLDIPLSEKDVPGWKEPDIKRPHGKDEEQAFIDQTMQKLRKTLDTLPDDSWKDTPDYDHGFDPVHDPVSASDLRLAPPPSWDEDAFHPQSNLLYAVSDDIQRLHLQDDDDVLGQSFSALGGLPSTAHGLPGSAMRARSSSRMVSGTHVLAREVSRLGVF